MARTVAGALRAGGHRPGRLPARRTVLVVSPAAADDDVPARLGYGRRRSGLRAAA